MDSKTQALVAKWQASLTQKERDLHALAAVKLKKALDFPGDGDSGSYYPEKSRAFLKWLQTEGSVAPLK